MVLCYLKLLFIFFFFFFSSRRRHTRSLRDWSSDVFFRSPGRDPHGAFLERDGGGGPAELAQDAELTEELGLIQRRVEHPVPGDGERAHLDPTRPQEQQLTGLVALMEEVGAPSVVPDVPPGRELLNVTGPHRPHERCFGHGSDERGKVA